MLHKLPKQRFSNLAARQNALGSCLKLKVPAPTPDQPNQNFWRWTQSEFMSFILYAVKLSISVAEHPSRGQSPEGQHLQERIRVLWYLKSKLLSQYQHSCGWAGPDASPVSSLPNNNTRVNHPWSHSGRGTTGSCPPALLKTHNAPGK